VQVPYEVQEVNIMEGAQKDPTYMKLQVRPSEHTCVPHAAIHALLSSKASLAATHCMHQRACRKRTRAPCTSKGTPPAQPRFRVSRG
jgi:hypothetical protein